MDRLAGRLRFLPTNLSDVIMQAGSKLFRRYLPARLRSFRDRYEHHLLLKVPGAATEFTRTMLAQMFPSALAAHYRKLDPCNALNPGLDKTS